MSALQTKGRGMKRPPPEASDRLAPKCATYDYNNPLASPRIWEGNQPDQPQQLNEENSSNHIHHLTSRSTAVGNVVAGHARSNNALAFGGIFAAPFISNKVRALVFF